jgi:hypothetical protein
MTTPFHNTVDLRGIHFEDRHLTVVLNSAIVKADEGKPVTIDSANNRVKIAGDGDSISAFFASLKTASCPMASRSARSSSVHR